ncbi:MAG: hypothetical protein NVS9B15_10780 [Acidobacteriaceae bacterium]
MRMMFRLLIADLLLCTLSFTQQSTTVFIVRHADKVSEAQDAVLSAQGIARAECLASTLRDADVGAIYTSDLLRTQQTAAPLAKAAHLEVHALPVRDVDRLVSQVRAEHGHNVLVVHHGNTIDKIVAALGAGTVPPIPSPEYDRLIAIELADGKAQPAVTLRYCAQLSASK